MTESEAKIKAVEEFEDAVRSHEYCLQCGGIGEDPTEYREELDRKREVLLHLLGVSVPQKADCPSVKEKL